MKKKITFCCHPHPHKSGVGFAALLIIAGALLLCNKLNIIPARYSDALISWQMLLILIGVLGLVKRHFYNSIILISLGVFFIIPEIGKVPNNFIGTVSPDFVHIYWPVLLIVAGVLMLIRWIFPHKRRYKIFEGEFSDRAKYYQGEFSDRAKYYHPRRHYHSNRRCGENRKYGESGFIDKNSMFESGEHIVLDPEFKGGTVNTAFGETKLDLRKTNLAEERTEIEINVAFGSVTIFVPEDWNVQLNVNSMFGAFQDKRLVKNSDTNTNSSKILVIYGSILFGGGELRN
ncbi:MAG: LiaF-related protein [Paludibacteraceae bacterium]|nr:LiaF-related protein [Paludibacteraceae bacterium]